MTFVAPRRFQIAGLLAMLAACQHDAAAPADTPVVVEPLGAAQVNVVQEPATPDGRVTLVVRVGAHDLAMSSFQGTMNFKPGAFELVARSTPTGRDGAAFVINTESFAEGRVRFAAFTSAFFADADAGIDVVRLTVRPLRPVAEANVTAELDVVGTDAGRAIRAAYGIRGYSNLVTPGLASACAANTHVWGDANGDDEVSVPDAQQIARFASLLSVVDPDVVSDRGDVNGDGAVDIIDAQQIARFSVGLAASARVSAAMPVRATSIAVAPGLLSLRVGVETQVTAVPRDAGSGDLSACVALTWSSSDGAIAQVDASGLVTGLAPGSATITAAGGGRSSVVSVTVAENSRTASQRTR
jgi:hypothetical protein